jgi:outer membrane receptor for ferrienterochelin and colicins
MLNRILFILFTILYYVGFSQNAHTISGNITSEGKPLPYANIYLESTSHGTISNIEGYYEIKDVQAGDYTIVISMTGYKTQRQRLTLNSNTT